MTTLTETHRDVQSLAREFAANEIAPNAARWNEDHHIPVDVIRRMGALGFLGVIVPEQYGGAGLDAVALALVMEEIAAADAGISVSIAVQNGLVAAPILRAGTDDQKRAWLPRIAGGEVARLLRPHRTRRRVGHRGACEPGPSPLADGYRHHRREAVDQQRRPC